MREIERWIFIRAKEEKTPALYQFAAVARAILRARACETSASYTYLNPQVPRWRPVLSSPQRVRLRERGKPLPTVHLPAPRSTIRSGRIRKLEAAQPLEIKPRRSVEALCLPSLASIPNE